MNASGLLPYQVEPAKCLFDMLSRDQNVLDGSDCGVGKTYVACAVIREMRVATLVLCPQISITTWTRVGEAMGTEFDVLNVEAIRTGKTPFGQWDNPKPSGPAEVVLTCESCQRVIEPVKPSPCPHHLAGIHCVSVKKKVHDYGQFRWHPNIKFMVVDEAHRFGAMDSLNATMLIAARRQGIRILALSATAADSPMGLRALGYVLGLHTLVGDNSFYRFAFRHGAKKHPFGGLYFGGEESERREKMAGLHREIFPSRGVRVRIKDLGDAFPECQVKTELYDLAGAKKIDALYAEMDDAIQRLNDKRLNDQTAVTAVLRARQEIEFLTVPVFEEIARQSIENGLHVALFVNFKETLAELSKRLKTTCIVEGGQNPAVRQNNIDRFQADIEAIILLNAQAGGVSISLHDLIGQFPRVGVVSLGYSAVQLKQILGRLFRSGAKSKALYRIPLVAGSCQEKIHRAVSGKLNQLDSLNDGDLFSANLPLQGGEISHLFRDT